MSGERLKFRAVSQNEQARLSDDDLVAYLRSAGDSGQDDEAATAAGILVSRRIDVLASIVRNRINSAGDEDVEDIVSTVMEHTIKARFDGKHAGQFFSLMLTILDRRIVDFIDRQGREPKIARTFDDGTSSLDLVVDGEDPIGASALLVTLQGVLEKYSQRDRMVIEMRIDGIPSKEVAERVQTSGVEDGAEMSFQNVDQIYKRFRDRHREELDPGTPGSPGLNRAAEGGEAIGESMPGAVPGQRAGGSGEGGRELA